MSYVYGFIFGTSDNKLGVRLFLGPRTVEGNNGLYPKKPDQETTPEPETPPATPSSWPTSTSELHPIPPTAAPNPTEQRGYPGQQTPTPEPILSLEPEEKQGSETDVKTSTESTGNLSGLSTEVTKSSEEHTRASGQEVKGWLLSGLRLLNKLRGKNPPQK